MLVMPILFKFYYCLKSVIYFFSQILISKLCSEKFLLLKKQSYVTLYVKVCDFIVKKLLEIIFFE